MSNQEEFYRTMRIDIPPSLLHGVDSTGVRKRMVTVPRRTLQKPAARKEPVEPQNHFQQLLKSIYDAVVITDAAGKIVHANERAQEFLQYTLAELQTMTLPELISGADARLVSTIVDVLATDRFLLLQVHGQRKDQTLFPAEISVNVLDLEEVRYCFFIRDITVRKQSEEMLRTGFNAISNAGNGLAVADLAGRLVYVNPAMVSLWGCDRAETLVGRNVRELWVDDADAEPMIAAIAQRHENWNGELLGMREDGLPLHIQASAACNRDADDELIGMVLSFTDIGDRKKAEAARRDAESQQAMVASLATACHHIGQPATVILGSLGLLRELLKDQDAETLGIIDDSIEAAEQVASILHKFNRLTVYKTINYLDTATHRDAPRNKLLDLEVSEDQPVIR